MTLAIIRFNKGTLNCSYNELLVVSGAGSFYIDYKKPYLYAIDQGFSSYNSKLHIYDLSDPFGPAHKSTTNLPNGSGARHPRCYGDKLYIPYEYGLKLAIWDVTNRSAPALLGECPLSYPTFGPNAGPAAVAVIGNIACCPLGNGFFMPQTSKDVAFIDVSNPAAPAVVSTFQHGPVLHANIYVEAFGEWFFVGGQRSSGGPGYISSFNKNTFALGSTILSQTTGAGEVVSKTAMLLDGSRLYTPLNPSCQIWTIDTSNPAAMVTKGEVAMTQTGGGNYNSIVCCEDINRLYIGRGNGGGLLIPIMDITNRDVPVPSGSISTSGETVTDIARITDGCPGFAWCQGTGAAIHLIGQPPLS